jgi:hypothetical protein
MEKDLQLLMFDVRMEFMRNSVIDKKITFSSSYFCYNFLPKQLIMESLNKPSSRKQRKEISLID